MRLFKTSNVNILMKTIRRTSKIKLIYSNTGKKDFLNLLFTEDANQYCLNLINKLIYQETIPTFIPKEDLVDWPFTGTIKQLLSKECSSIARSLKEKIKKARNTNNLKKHQQEILDKFVSKSIIVKSIGQLNLDQRFVSIEESVDSSFDYWIAFNIPSCGKVYIPFKKTKHIKNLLDRGYILKSSTLRIKRNGEVELCFTKDIQDSTGTEHIGIDIGRNKSFVTSRNESEFITKRILNNLKNKKYGSRNQTREKRRLRHIIDHAVKHNIDWSSLRMVSLEKLTNLKSCKKYGQTNHHWSYSYIQNRIRLISEELGVHVLDVNPAYTSQMCSKCGFKDKNNRVNEKFKCLNCFMEIDADLNGSINIKHKGNMHPMATKFKHTF